MQTISLPDTIIHICYPDRLICEIDTKVASVCNIFPTKSLLNSDMVALYICATVFALHYFIFSFTK